MEKIVLDTYAVMAFFFNEKGADKVERIMKDAVKKGNVLMMSSVNCGEFFYAVTKKAGAKTALKALDMIDSIPVHIQDAGRDLAVLAGSIKAENKMSYADCFAAALAMIHKAPVVTGDKEFKQVEKEIKIIWV
ncbi:MAG: type II toxin-antitoxin system VapC family toxin [Candidatus Goldbacteria bacterium]|nr:type II toxin-antitoxin system VapC family toxin [Candidatus Goldiibacteriota bacterium]